MTRRLNCLQGSSARSPRHDAAIFLVSQALATLATIKLQDVLEQTLAKGFLEHTLATSINFAGWSQHNLGILQALHLAMPTQPLACSTLQAQRCLNSSDFNVQKFESVATSMSKTKSTACKSVFFPYITHITLKEPALSSLRRLPTQRNQHH